MPSPRKSKEKKPTQKAVRATRALETIPHPGFVFPDKHYVFIAKAKAGELWALNHLSIDARAAITPLFEMYPPKKPRKKKGSEAPAKAPKTLSVHATDVLTMIRDEWGTLPFFLDSRYIPEGGIPSPSTATTIFDICQTLKLAAIPVTSLTFEAAYQQAIRGAIAKLGHGGTIRLFVEDFIVPSLLGDYLTALLGVLQVPRNQTDIVIDLGFRPQQIEVQQLGAHTISALPFQNEWRTITLASGCFPEQISGLSHGKWWPLPRTDWAGWMQVRTSQKRTNGRLPTYGDYGVRCGGIPKDIPNPPEPNIRYSDKDKVLVRRGPKTLGTMRLICSSIVGRTEFSGVAFSEGDREIAAKAATQGSSKNGSPGQWIQWSGNHHLELTASQIRNLP
jgi:hypothetical protein